MAAKISVQTQRGLGLVETLLLTLLIGGSLAAGFLWLVLDTPAKQAAEQQRVLDAADRALESFAAIHGRLPCPDNDQDGYEDCTGQTRGGLPWRELQVEDPDIREGLATLAYAVPSAQLLYATNLFEPAGLGTVEFRSIDSYGRFGLPEQGDDFSDYGNITVLDFCVSLAALGGEADYPAYGIAHPGVRDRDGSGGLFDGANTAEIGLAPASDSQSAEYDDLVRERSRAQLAQALDCATLGISIDSLSLASIAVDEVYDQQTWLLLQEILVNIPMSAIQVVMSGIKVAMAGKGMGASITELGIASGVLAAAIASCVILIGCAEIPHAALWVAASTAAIAAHGVSIAANLVATYLSVGAFATHLSIAIDMGTDIDEVAVNDEDLAELGIDLNDITSMVSIDSLQEDIVEQLTDIDETIDELTDEVEKSFEERKDSCNCPDDDEACEKYEDELNNGLDAYLDDEMVEIMEDVINKSDDTDASIDLITELRQRAMDNLQAQQDLEEAIAELESAERSDDYGDTEDAEEAQEALAEHLDDILEDIDEDIAETEEKLSQTSDPDEQEQLETELEALQEARDSLVNGGQQSQDEQLAQIDEAIADIDEQISEIDEQIAKTDDDSLAEQLQTQKADLVSMRQDLQQQRNEISPDIESLEQQVEDAEDYLETTSDLYDLWRDKVIGAAKGTYEEKYEEEVCTGSGDNGECHTETYTQTKEYDRQMDMLLAVTDYFQAKSERPEEDPDDADSNLEACYLADLEWQENQTALAEAEEQKESIQDLVDMLSDPDQQFLGSPLTLWNDTDAILEEADQRGGGLGQ